MQIVRPLLVLLFMIKRDPGITGEQLADKVCACGHLTAGKVKVLLRLLEQQGFVQQSNGGFEALPDKATLPNILESCKQLLTERKKRTA